MAVLFQSACFFSCDMNDGTVLGALKIVGLHYAFVEATKWGESLEVGSLYETEVMRTDAEDVVHYHPAVSADTPPGVRSLTGTWFGVHPSVL